MGDAHDPSSTGGLRPEKKEFRQSAVSIARPRVSVNLEVRRLMRMSSDVT